MQSTHTCSLALSFLLVTHAACGSGGTTRSSDGTSPASGDSAHADESSADAGSSTSSTEAGTKALGAPGEHDTTFGQGGLVKSKYYALDVVAPPLAVRADSSIHLRSYKGVQTGVGTLTTQGTLDVPSFLAPASDWPTDFAPTALTMADAVLYVAATGDSQHHVYVARASGGGFDTTFGKGGLATVPDPTEPFAGHWGPAATDIAVRDGATYVLRSFASNTPDKYAFGVIRLTAQGAPDATFGASGIAVIDTSPTLTSVVALRVDDAGRIYVGASASGAAPRVVRLSASGALDPSFGSGGFSDPAIGSGGMQGFELDASGRVVLATTRNGQAAVARLDGGGALDKAFGAGGIASSGISASKGRGLVLTPEGMIVLGCIATNASDDLALARFDETGALDPNFGTGGRAVLDRPGDQKLIAGGMVYDPRGRVVVVSESNDGTLERWIERFWL